MMKQRYRIFFFRGHGRWSFIHSNPKIVFFFFSAKRKKPEKKKHKHVFFFFPGKVHRSFIRIFDGFLFFLIKVGCVFFFPGFWCVFLCFFFPGKVHKPFIHSNFWAEKKKHNPGKKKKQLFYSFIRYSSKMPKNELFRVKKKNTIPLLKAFNS